MFFVSANSIERNDNVSLSGKAKSWCAFATLARSCQCSRWELLQRPGRENSEQSSSADYSGAGACSLCMIKTQRFKGDFHTTLSRLP